MPRQERERILRQISLQICPLALPFCECVVVKMRSSEQRRGRWQRVREQLSGQRRTDSSFSRPRHPCFRREGVITIEIGRGRGSLKVQLLGLLQSETGRGVEAEVGRGEGEGGRERGKRREEAEAGGEGYVAIGAGGEQGGEEEEGGGSEWGLKGCGHRRGHVVLVVVRLFQK